MSRNYCCVDCGGLISIQTALCGGGRCNSCAHKGTYNWIINNIKIKDDKELYNFLYNEYIIKHQSLNQIAKNINKDSKTVLYHIKRLNILTRTKSEASKYSKSVFKKGNNNNFKGKSFEELFGDKIAKRMKNNLSKLASKRVGKLNSNFNNHKLAGINNPSYIHGQAKRKYSYEFRQKKSFIKQRDNYQCQICNKYENALKHKLCVHHIDYNKENNKNINLISLCLQCHLQTNFNRTMWQIYCTYLMNNIKENSL
jgi:hypothetical protein